MHSTVFDPEYKADAAVLLQALSGLLKEDDLHRLDLAQHLHKEVAGSLVVGTSLGEMMRHELAHGCDAVSIGRLLTSLDSTLRQALQQVRNLTEEQFPPVLKAFGLHVALQQLVRSIAEEFAGSLVLHINGDEPKFDLAGRLNLFRLMQSLLQHCVSYAQTSWVEVTCHATAEKLEITIDHNGGGSIWNETGDSDGMAIVAARCILLGSRMQVMRAGPGSGSRVSLVVVPSPMLVTP